MTRVDDHCGCVNCAYLLWLVEDEWFCLEYQNHTHPSAGKECKLWQLEDDETRCDDGAVIA